MITDRLITKSNVKFHHCLYQSLKCLLQRNLPSRFNVGLVAVQPINWHHPDKVSEFEKREERGSGVAVDLVAISSGSD